MEAYKYMIWLDRDASVGKTWTADPIQMMVENDLTILYAGLPYGRVSDPGIRNKLMAAYNTPAFATRMMQIH